METNRVVQIQHLISETRSPGKDSSETAVFRSYATVFRNEVTGDTLALQFSTTFSLAKKPDEHRVTLTINFKTNEEADKLVDFLVEKA